MSTITSTSRLLRVTRREMMRRNQERCPMWLSLIASRSLAIDLASIVGTKTPGRLLSGSAYKVGHGYILGLPVAGYLTWQGRMLENNGIVPKFSIELSREALKQGRDTQLGTAVEVAKG